VTYGITNTKQRTILHGYATGKTVTELAAAGHDKAIVEMLVADVAKFDRGRAREIVLAYDRHAGQAAAVPAQWKRLQDQLAQVTGQRDQALLDREEAVRERDAARRKVTDLTEELAHVRGQLGEAHADCARYAAAAERVDELVNGNRRLRRELDRANAGRLKLQEELDAAVHNGLTAATQVINRYEAYACEQCGARYGRAYTDHGCGPLASVTVTIARRPAGAQPKEQ
jgi:hypothetical protein